MRGNAIKLRVLSLGLEFFRGYGFSPRII